MEKCFVQDAKMAGENIIYWDTYKELSKSDTHVQVEYEGSVSTNGLSIPTFTREWIAIEEHEKNLEWKYKGRNEPL